MIKMFLLGLIIGLIFGILLGFIIFCFLSLSKEQKVSSSDKNEHKTKERREIEQEKKATEMLQTIDIYDYKEEDADRIINQLIRSISLLKIISKCLPGFEHNMNASMRKAFVEEIYSLPNKIYFMWAKEVDTVYSDLIKYLKERGQDEYQNQGDTKSDAVEIKFKLVAALLLLEIYNISVNHATRANSFRLLDKFEREETLTYKLQNLMMVEKQKLPERFVQEAISLYQTCNQNLTKFLLLNVVKHAYINMKSLDFKQLDKLDSAFFKSSPSQGGQALIEQKAMMIKRSKKIKKVD
mgnify:CR=1 FL=1